MENILLIACAVIVLVWTHLCYQVRMAMKRLKKLHPVHENVPGKISVVIPARNEAAALEPALKSVLAQKNVDMEVILINDHSTDETGEIADRLAKDHPALRVLHDPELPPGWLGKTNAMQKGAAMCDGDFILFTDADIIHKPGCFASAVKEMRESKLDFLSLIPELMWVTLMENAVLGSFFSGIPVFAGAKMNDPDSKDAAGAGAFLMFSMKAYRAVGGHESVRLEVIDDIQIARQMKRRGYKVMLMNGRELLLCRMYRSNKEAFWAFTKNILGTVEGKPWAAALLFPFLALTFWTGAATALIGAVEGDLALVAAGIGLHVFIYSGFYIARKELNFNRWKIFFYPLGVVAVGASLLRALYYKYVKGSVQWRGRMVKIDEGEESGKSAE